MSAPALRFDDGQAPWSEESLINLSESGFTNGVFNDPKKTGRGYKLINVLDMYIDTTIDENRLSLVELGDAEFKKNKVEHGEIFFTRSSLVKDGIAFSNIYLGHSQDVTFDGHLIRMRPRKDVLNSVFANYLLRTSKVRKQLVERGKTATMTTIGQADIAAVMVRLPSLPEQNKIANFLTAVDEKLAQITRKHDLLTQYKKGVMQQIFSQELRFKDDDGREFPEWEEKQADEIFYSHSNKNHNGEHPILAATQDKGMIYRQDTGLDIKSSEASIKSYKLVEKGDFVISLRSFQGGIEYSNLMGICSPVYTVLKSKLEIDDRFFAAYMKMEDFIERLSSTVVGIRDGKQISFSAFSTMRLVYPCVEEQTKIANFLAAIDEKITATQTQLAAVKQYKQGLLQQMFV